MATQAQTPLRSRFATALLVCMVLLAPAVVFRNTDSRRALDAGIRALVFPGSSSGGTLLDVGEPKRLYGRQRKHGPLAILTQLQGLDNPSIRKDGYGRGHLDLYPPQWVKERLAGNVREPLYREAGLMVSDRYKLIFVKCTKTAGGIVLAGERYEDGKAGSTGRWHRWSAAGRPDYGIPVQRCGGLRLCCMA